MPKIFRLGFFGAILVWVPVLLLGIFERQISGLVSRPVWIVAMVTFSAGALFLHIYPFFYRGPGSYEFFWGKGKKAQSVIREGRLARATLLEIGENSGGGTVTINDNPYLNLKLSIDDGKSAVYEVSLDTVIPRYSVPLFQPGFTFPVRIDNKNPEIVVYDADEAALAGDGTVIGASKPKITSPEATPESIKFIKKSGIKAQARITGIEPTGRSHEYKPLVKVTYEVLIPGQEPYLTVSELPIPTHLVEKFEQIIGKSFPAKVHPEDKDRISVDIDFG
ncbi:hypothetical protein GF359_00950 [candidate division WOR-3 bacterium]|uniref:Uncharacterized protein n=1 Tax=candidate division WOR-3 bacterium TaxID=2052148 RepID=A0A9D5QC88_UNCW3|nr:hypothetical protein [candidate division WOR-3 bacterium]MBD3363761.1 hypothetical protein [candidate division WOR-3 bacterium]